MVDQLLEQEVGALAAFGADDGRQRVEPLARFLGVGVVGGGAEEGSGRADIVSPGMCFELARSVAQACEFSNDAMMFHIVV